MIAGCGCPSTDRKVVNSGKRLRAHVSIDEGNVCVEFPRSTTTTSYMIEKFWVKL